MYKKNANNITIKKHLYLYIYIESNTKKGIIIKTQERGIKIEIKAILKSD